MFDSILGNPSAKAYLTKALQEERLPHALLFSGASGIGKTLFAQELARYVLESSPERIEKEIHPDFHVLHPEGKSGIHSIETLRGLIEDVHAAPFEGKAKVFVLHNAERMQPAAANALLKTLEEPSPLTLFILITSNLAEVLPTIQSRCSILRFQLLATSEVAELLKRRGIFEGYAQGSQGSIGRAIELSEGHVLQDLLFPLLDENLPYAKKALQIEKLNEAVEDEDPLQMHRKIDSVLEIILMRYRDAALRQSGAAPHLLFFPTASFSKLGSIDFDRIVEAVEEMRLALSRNIRFSVCLEQLLLR